MRLAEIGARIRQQRKELGLTQEQLAKLTELSGPTIDQLESGTLEDLSYAKLAHILSVLGLDLYAQPSKGLQHALAVAARTVSTSYKTSLSPEILTQMLVSGQARPEFRPHLMTLLDETPLPVVIQAVHEASQNSSTATETMIQHLATWADELHAHRTVWG